MEELRFPNSMRREERGTAVDVGEPPLGGCSGDRDCEFPGRRGMMMVCANTGTRPILVGSLISM